MCEVLQEATSTSGMSSSTSSQASPSSSTGRDPNLVAQLAEGWFGGSEERDPIEAFTLYGTTFKKFVIEQLQGEKIVSRKRGEADAEHLGRQGLQADEGYREAVVEDSIQV